jgi:hypothetical protein
MDSMDKGQEKKKIWHPQQQIILKKWGEIGSSYRYLHDKAFMYYSKQNFRFALPVIILSTITGTANFAQKSFPESTQDYVPLFIGFLNLTAGLITTVGQFLRVSELLEGHRSASLAYSKFSRNIAVELSLPVKQRTTDGSTFIKKCRAEIDRLIEQSPNIPQNILQEFGKKFENKDFVKPEILDIGAVEIYIDNEECEEQAELLAIKQKDRERIILAEAQDHRDIIRKELESEMKKEQDIVINTLQLEKKKKKERVTGDTIANSMDKLIKRLKSPQNIINMKGDDESISISSSDSERNIEMSISNMDKIINNTVKDTINDIITEVEEEEVLLEIKL